MDLISRQDAIDALGEKPLVWDDLNDFDLGKAAQWSDDVDAIKALPPEQPEYTEQDVRDAFNDGYRCGMESAQPQPEKRTEERTETHSCDCIERQAVEHLDRFTKIYCRDKSITDDLAFRCGKCEFEMPDKTCLVKVMARKLCPDYKDFGAMGDL